MHLQSLKRIMDNKYFKWINIIFVTIYFLFIMAIDIKDLGSNVAYSTTNTFISFLINPYVKLGIITYIVFVPCLEYFAVYKKLLNKKIDMDLLITLAIHISYLFSMFIVILSPTSQLIIEPIGLLYAFDNIGKSIEDYIARRNSREKQSLESLKDVEVKLENGTVKKINDVKVDDIIIFKKDDIIQFDGVISKNDGIIDTSNINGESKPYYAKINSNIISGSKVISEEIYLKTKKNFHDSTLNNLIEMLNKTNHAKPNIQIHADRIAKKFIPSVLIITLVAFIIWVIVGSTTGLAPLLSPAKNGYIYNAFFVAISALAIACPCAMTMTAPLISYVSAQSYWRNNIIFNKIEDMEVIDKVDSIILDKTGTLTVNEMEIIQEFGEKKYHNISAALEETVFHPIAMSIYKKYKSNVKVDNIVEASGHGVNAKLNSKNYYIGKVTSEELEKVFNTKIEKGTLVGLYENKKLVAGYVLQATLAPNVKKLIKFLKNNNITPMIVSGDNEAATTEVGNILDIDFRYGQSPEDKAKIIQSLQKEGKTVMAVGDGLNDSIAIKYSDVSASFASGSSITNSYSSVTFLSSDLNNLIYLFKMAKKTRINYNVALAWALGFNIFFIPFAVLGLITPFLSAVIMYVSNVVLFIIIGNFSRILKKLELRIYGKKTKSKVKQGKNLYNKHTGLDKYKSSDHCSM